MRQIGRSISDLLDPLVAKRANVDLSLALAWQQVAGEKLAGRTQPLKILWPQRQHADEAFKPGTLLLAAEGSVVLDLQYQSSELLDRINRFFGYPAVNRIKIEQKPIVRFRERQKPVEPVLSQAEQAELATSLERIDDAGLRETLLRLGTRVLGKKR